MWNGAVGLAVEEGAQAAAAQQLGPLVGVDLIALVAAAVLPASIADDDARDQWADQLVQPLGLGALFQGHVDGAAHTTEELDEARFLGGQDGAGDDAPTFLADQGDGGCLVDVEGDLFDGPSHESTSLR
jgi:hypothetical protein